MHDTQSKQLREIRRINHMVNTEICSLQPETPCTLLFPNRRKNKLEKKKNLVCRKVVNNQLCKMIPILLQFITEHVKQTISKCKEQGRSIIYLKVLRGNKIIKSICKLWRVKKNCKPSLFLLLLTIWGLETPGVFQKIDPCMDNISFYLTWSYRLWKIVFL